MTVPNTLAYFDTAKHIAVIRQTHQKSCETQVLFKSKFIPILNANSSNNLKEDTARGQGVTYFTFFVSYITLGLKG